MSNALQAIEQAQAAGIVLSINGDKLNIRGEQSPDLDRIIQMIKPIKFDVIEALQQQSKIGTWNAAKVAPKAVVAPANKLAPVEISTPEPAPQPDLFATAENMVEHSIQPEVVATVAKLNARTDDLQKFVGQVVSDNDMMILYYRAHRAGATLTSEWLGESLPCDHRVTGCWLA